MPINGVLANREGQQSIFYYIISQPNYYFLIDFFQYVV